MCVSSMRSYLKKNMLNILEIIEYQLYPSLSNRHSSNLIVHLNKLTSKFHRNQEPTQVESLFDGALI